MTISIDDKLAKTEYQIHDLLEARWSPRVFSENSLSEKEVHTLFEAARWAASSYNQQPWRFIYAHKGTEAYEKIFSCLSEFNQSWVRFAPVLVLTAYQKNFDEGKGGKENFHALHDLGLAVGNLTFQAQNMGIALHQMAGVDWEEAHQKFNVPEGYHVATAIAIGFYGGDPEKLGDDLEKQETAERNRKKLTEIVSEGEWNF